MKFFELPLTEKSFEELRLPDTARKWLLYNDRVVSKSLLHAQGTNQFTSGDSSWLLTELDEKFSIKRIALKSQKFYWVLGPSSKQGTGFICIPINNECLSNSIKQGMPSKASSDVISMLKDSFDHFDIEKYPFATAGGLASDFADFSEPEALVADGKWKKAKVLYSELGGDALLVTGDNSVAWHRLETNEILPCGKLKQVIPRYFKHVLTDHEFSSWTDVGLEKNSD